MDPIQVLASQKLEQHTSAGSQAHIDAFYDEHGYEAFLRVRRLWGTLRASLRASWPTKPESQIFAPSGRNV